MISSCCHSERSGAKSKNLPTIIVGFKKNSSDLDIGK